MGINHSKSTDTTTIVDFGSILPLGLYQKTNNYYDLNLVKKLILSKKLSPFYKGLNIPLSPDDKLKTAAVEIKNDGKKKRRLLFITQQEKTIQDYHVYYIHNEKKLNSVLYNQSIECPICFLYYPANINFARCCDQPICTECFVQIKNTTDDTLCPFCMTQDFGVIYSSPSSCSVDATKCYQVLSTTSGLSENQSSKRKSIESSHPDVVLIDHVRSRHRDKVTTTSNLSFWFQSRPHAASLERYLATIRLEELSIEDLMVIETIRRNLIESEQQQAMMY